MQTGFTYLPSATLYGAEVELQKYVPLAGSAAATFFATRRLVAIANYTYTKSQINADASCVPNPRQRRKARRGWRAVPRASARRGCCSGTARR